MTSETGVFWLPSDPDTRVPGHLVLAEDGSPSLELHGPLTPSLRVKSQNPETGETVLEPANDPPNLIVHGFLEHEPRRVTLVDCMTTGRTEVQFGLVPLSEQRLRALHMVRGAHTSGRNEEFSGVRLRVAGIDSWASLPVSQRTNLQDGGVSVGFPSIDLPEFETSKGVKLSLEVETRSSWGRSATAQIERHVWLQVENLGDLPLRRIERLYLSPLHSYLSFALGERCPLIAVQVKLEADWLEVRHKGVHSQAESGVDRGEVLLPVYVAGLDILAAFLDTYERTGPAAAVIADLLPQGSSPTIETQVLELTTVAEGVHRALYPEDVRMSEEDANRLRDLVAGAIAGESSRHQQIVNGGLKHLEESNYRGRLKRLADVVREGMPGVTGKENRWVDRVDTARNSFAHRTQGFLDDARIDEFYAVSQSLRWVLMGVLLLRSGVTPEVLSTRLGQDQRYYYYLENMKSSLPAVYQQ